jgi:hypothetical protein
MSNFILIHLFGDHQTYILQACYNSEVEEAFNKASDLHCLIDQTFDMGNPHILLLSVMRLLAFR